VSILAEGRDKTMAEPNQVDNVGTDGEKGHSRAFFYALDELPTQSIADMVVGMDDEQAEGMLDLFGRDLLTKTILQSPQLSMYHEVVGPGQQVKPHRHGTHQITYVLRGSLNYGNRTTSAGMGYFSPDRRYSWTAGDEGAEWLEIHAGEPKAFVDD
jgi:hypothetical protein